jgi:hypothetical protein
MPELQLRRAPVPLMASAVGTSRLAWKYVDLDDQWTYAVEF